MTPAEPSPPPVIPDYELLRLVGRGSYGDVWLARGVTGLYRAVKIVWRDRFPDPQPYEREFKGLKEFAAISLLESRQLALLHVSRNDAAGFFYYVMELADDAETGREIVPERYVPFTLRELRARRGRLPATESIALGADLARALGGLHTRGLVHRDIKPSNVILVGGVPKLADIGLVTTASPEQTFVGTEGFVPPEGPGAPSADVYSLGKLLYELATGLDRHDYPRLPPDLDALPDRKELLELNAILIRACDPAAAKRHRDAAALLDDLLLLQAGRSVRRLRATERRLARALRVAAVLALIAAIAGAGAWVAQQHANREMVLREKAEAERDDLARRSVYAATLAQAQRALEQEDYGQARKLLQQVAEKNKARDLRGFEWQALWHEAQGDPCDVVRRTGPMIDSLALSPDGRLLAVHDEGRNLTLYEVATHKEVRQLAELQRFGGFSGDGRWLIGTTADGRLERRRTTDSLTETTPSRSVFDRAIGAFGDEGIAFEDGSPPTVIAWDFPTRRVVLRIALGLANDRSPWKLFRSAALRDGSQIALDCIQGSGSDAPRRLLVVDVSHGTIVQDRIASDIPTGLWSRASSKSFVTASFHASGLFALDPANPAEVLASRTDGGAIVAWAENPALPNSHYVARLGSTIEHYSSNPAAIIDRLRGQGGRITALLCAPEAGTLFSSSSTGELRAWPLASRANGAVQTVAGWGSGVGYGRIVYSPDGVAIAVPSDGKSCRLLAASGLVPIADLSDVRTVIGWIANRVWGVSADGTGLFRSELDERSAYGPTNRVAFEQSRGDQLQNPQVSKNGRFVAAGLSDGTICVWDGTTGKLRRTVRLHQIATQGLAFLPDETALWSIGADRSACRLDLASNRPPLRQVLSARVAGVAVSPDGHTLALGCEDGRIELRDAATGELQRAWNTSSGPLYCATFSPDGRRLATGDEHGRIQFYDAAGWMALVEFNVGADRFVTDLCFSPKSVEFAAMDAAGGFRIWQE